MVVLSELTVRAINISVLSFCSLELLILLVSFPRFKLKYRASRIFYAKMLVSTFTIISYTISIIIEAASLVALNILAHSMSYVGIYAVFVLFIMYVVENINKAEGSVIVSDNAVYVSVVIGIIGSLIWVISLFDRNISELSSHHLHYGRVFAIGHLGGFLLIFISLWLLIKYRKALGVRETGALLSMPILLFLATLLEPLSQGIELRFPSVVLEFIIIYTQHFFDLEFKEELRETRELKQRMNMATGRMKPHYLYNVLTTIYYLVESAPEKAQSAIGMLSEYLRSTLETIQKNDLVEFSWELAEIRNYLALEKLRFGDRLTVEYEIEQDEFMIPPLTVQSLVENAVDYGISASETGGTVKIVTKKLHDGRTQIQIIDDGVGFDVNAIEMQDPDYEGIISLRRRLRREIGGVLEITSVPGEGTTATITIEPRSADK